MKTITGYYQSTNTDEINFTFYRDDNGIWCHLIVKRGKLIATDIRVELTDENAEEMGKELTRLARLAL